jgi:hypothetical protein
MAKINFQSNIMIVVLIFLVILLVVVVFSTERPEKPYTRPMTKIKSTQGLLSSRLEPQDTQPSLKSVTNSSDLKTNLFRYIKFQNGKYSFEMKSDKTWELQDSYGNVLFKTPKFNTRKYRDPVLMISGSGNLCQIDNFTGKILFQTKTTQDPFGSVSLILTKEGKLVLFQTRPTPKILWEK